jgi:protein-tyrosine phosphatase
MNAPTGPLEPLRSAGAVNLRDLGGVRTSDGCRVRTGRLLRCDYPAFAEGAAGADVVARSGLRTVVDLRLEEEIGVECPPWTALGVDHRQVSLVSGRGDSWHAGYARYLVHRPQHVVEAVRLLMELPGPALFHCAAGKDRTGVVAALLLKALDVPDDEVTADYVRTAEVLPTIMTRLLGHEYYQRILARTTLEDQTPTEQNIGELLAHLAAAGGAERWLLDHGLPEETLAAFRAAMLE